MSSVEEAAKVKAPRNAGHRREGKVASITSASTAATATGATSNRTRQWFTFIATTDIHLAFGNSAMAAADSNDMFYPSGQQFSVVLEPEETHFRAIRDSADGSMYYYLSSG